MDNFTLDDIYDEYTVTEDGGYHGWNISSNNSSSCEPNYYGSTFRTLKIAVDVYIVGVLCVLGITGNVISFFVLRNMRGCTAPRLLQALAAADSAFLLTCLVFQTGRVIFFYFPSARGWSWFPYVEVWVWPLAAISQMSTVYIVVLVTVDRWRAVCFPLKRATHKHMKIALVVVILWAVVFNIPTFMDMEVRWINETCRLEARASALYTNAHYQLVYKTILCFLFRTMLPLITIIVLNIRLIHSVRVSGHQDLGTSKPRDEPGLNRLVIVLISVFILCSIPDVIIRLITALELYCPDFLPLDMMHIAYLGTLTNLMLTVNSACNFFIYSLTGTRFRHELRKMFCGTRDSRYKSVSSSVESKTQLSVTPACDAEHIKLDRIVTSGQ